MEPHFKVFAAALLLAGTASALAEVHYVDVNSTNATPPYTNWTTAAMNIQDAVDAALAGDEIVVTNGAYATGPVGNGARVVVNKPLNVRSVNGPTATTIDGGGEIRCAVLFDGVNLSGFTLTHGFASAYYPGGRNLGRGGAGVLCSGTNQVPASIAVISNCVITGNRAFGNISLRTMRGGGVNGGTLKSCKLIDNSVCVRVALAGGTCISSGGGASDSTLNNCTLVGNSANATNTGSILGSYAFAGGGGAEHCTLNNCTLTGNSANAVAPAPSLAFAGADACNLSDCVVYFNTDNYGASGNYESSCTLNYCCTTPESATGFGNITNAPIFLDLAGGELRLQSNSPCINAGNNSYVTNTTDLDGNPRIVGGTVDIGAYEFQVPASMISYAWLQQYGLPINPATDTADPDGDGVDNYHEWLAGTDPTNPFSSPAQLTITPSGVPPSGIILTWSTNAVGFTLQSTTNLVAPVWSTNSSAPFVIGGQNVVTIPIAGPQQFYRLSQ